MMMVIMVPTVVVAMIRISFQSVGSEIKITSRHPAAAVGTV